MKNICNLVAALVMTVLVGCGGGGGSPGANGSGSTGTAKLTLTLLNAAGVGTTSVSFSGSTMARAVFLDGSGTPVVGKIVTFSGDTAFIKFTSPSSGQVLTDSSGVATVQVSPASLTVSGAGTLKASASTGTTSATASLDFQMSPANLSLQSLNLGSSSLAAYGNRPISVAVAVDGVVSGTVPVQVSFAASCGSVGPTAALTDATGKASATYTADSVNCAGTNVTITASASGATSVSGTVAVENVTGSNLTFVSATPQRIYLLGSAGATQSQVVFKLVDSGGNALPNQAITLALTNTSTGASLGTLGATAALSRTTDASGLVSVPVFSGSVPTSVQVRASLQSNPTVTTTSNVLTVASGRPVQNRTSLSVEKLAIEGWNHDGTPTTVTLSMADRQGNPVPDGTEVNFVTEGGVVVPPVCTVAGGTSKCTVTLYSGEPRLTSSGTPPEIPPKGRISVLAYVPGEEDFVDTNGNNVYDAGEPFTDLGRAYRDDNENSILESGEFFVPRAGSMTCAGGPNGVANTCDGIWGPVDVRAQAIVVFATSESKITGAVFYANGMDFQVQDLNDNSMPVGTKLAAVGSPAACVVTKVQPGTIANSLVPANASITWTGCVPGNVIDISTTSPLGLTHTHRIDIH